MHEIYPGKGTDMLTTQQTAAIRIAKKTRNSLVVLDCIRASLLSKNKKIKNDSSNL